MAWHEVNDVIVITLPEIFDMNANLGYLTREKNECMYEIENNIITKVIAIGEIRSLVQVSVINNKQMIVQFLNDSRPVEQWKREEIVKYIHEWFDLDNDLTPFYELAKADPLLKMPARKFYGLRVIGIPDLFEALCWGVLGQQINLAFAYSLKKQFVEAFGDSIEWNGKKYWVFPPYERIARLTPTDLADIKMTVKKSEYIIGIARLMASGELSREKLMKMNFKDAEKNLIKIRGIGPWTANYVLMRCLRFPTAFPIDDVCLIRSIKILRNMNRKPTKDEILEISFSWKKWESYATFYLWRVLY
ncbi:DNA-3-methyladenine glycosidase II [Bacillus subtilis]|uniref:DNA-3-methyladenine glycosidase II n=1 Tax=Bacillus TaxID=1386 RepID=UPI000499DABF|nr:MULTISPECIES: DNA-3-methyladenine glycosidase II [Bacillus]AOL31998.1 DNA-3-methyladenine glycosylase [Alkalicoccobacillus gibsonii]MCL0027664.1 DNA-3-methyladenine glycosidase II [Bacillus sp. C21]AIC96825.1 DNA-3-methyladenine glycosylase [Bacillus subtilis subsp. subtilis str. OH 131.1]AOA52834.1 DNA-3-methyladenine glycosylase II [Bacillus subtilis]AOL28922.1 DNA-3-methyladenine glycosylase [Bacillus sp. FJAT-14266]